MNKAKQLALGRIFNLPDNHVVMKDLLADPDVVVLADIAVIDKEDVLSAEVDGKSLFAYPEVWAHMDEAVAYLREKGVDIRGNDFTMPVPGGKTPLALADDLDVMGKLFTPVIWDSRYDAMLNAWYGLGTSNPRRDKLDFITLQEQVAATEGRTSRLAQLKHMGIAASDMRSAITSGDYDKVKEKLEKFNDHIRPADLFIFDNWGDHGLDNSSGWKHFSKLWDELAKNGERLEVADFLFRINARDSILKDAQDASDGLQELFKPRLWYGRVDDAVTLYEMLPEESRKKVNIDNVIEEVIGHDYSARIDSGEITELKDIIEPINSAERENPNFHPILPLGLKEVWDRIAHVRTVLQANGESLALNDLRMTSGLHEEPCLLRAARYGAFDKVMDIVHAEGSRLSAEELTVKDGHGKAVVDYLAENGQITQILEPRDWVERAPELTRLWQAIPEKSRDQINFQRIIGNINTMALRQRFASRLPAPGA